MQSSAMSMEQLKNNLLTFLDPFCRLNKEHWQFVKDCDRWPEFPDHEDSAIIFHFTRKNLAEYLICSIAALVLESFCSIKVRRVLYLQNGLLSSFFDLHAAPAYRAFVRRHLPPLKGFRQILLYYISPFWLADQRFVVLESSRNSFLSDTLTQEPVDFMFYSNSMGKLMMTNAATMTSGSGKIYKTAATPEYAERLCHEHLIVTELSRAAANKLPLSGPADAHHSGDRHFYREEYLCGENLRELLRGYGIRNMVKQTCAMLDRLSSWFSAYRSIFSGQKHSLSSLYAPIIELFDETYGTADEGRYQQDKAREMLADLDRRHGGLIPVTAHNDLWPGNIIIQDMQLKVIDWERASRQSAPVFDYFWMIISAGMEYFVGTSGNQDYSHAFRQLLSDNEPVSSHAWNSIERFLDELGYTGTRQQFTLLFLLEWSIQGKKALGRTTEMDRLAYGELSAFSTAFFEQPLAD